MSKIIVFGSCSVDYTTYSQRFPRPGETVQGNKFTTSYGGKGANQCVAAAKIYRTTPAGGKILGNTFMVARVGDDMWGKAYIENMKDVGVNTEFVTRTEGHQTGVAQIMVDGNGENQIVIVEGSNKCLSAKDADAARDVISEAAVLVCQLETPVEASIRAFQICKGIKILNAAPAILGLNKELLAMTTILCVNRPEAAMITGKVVETQSQVESATKDLLLLGCEIVIVTLGADGASYASKEDPSVTHIPATKSKAVDTTGAGDAFVGALAACLAYGSNLSLRDKIKLSAYAASESVVREGTQTSFLSRSFEELVRDVCHTN